MPIVEIKYNYVRITRAMYNTSLCGVGIDGMAISYSDIDLLSTDWFKEHILPRRTPHCKVIDVIL